MKKKPISEQPITQGQYAELLEILKHSTANNARTVEQVAEAVSILNAQVASFSKEVLRIVQKSNKENEAHIADMLMTTKKYPDIPFNTNGVNSASLNINTPDGR